MNKNKRIIVSLLPFFLSAGLVYLFWRQSFLLLFLYASVLVIEIFLGHDRIVEVKLAVIGILWGFVLETIGISSGYHTFNKPDLMGIPLWLPIFWGYGFIAAKRVSSIVYTGLPFGGKQLL